MSTEQDLARLIAERDRLTAEINALAPVHWKPGMRARVGEGAKPEFVGQFVTVDRVTRRKHADGVFRPFLFVTAEGGGEIAISAEYLTAPP